MSQITTIQWADTTVNPIMGCGGCELFPNPGKVLTAIDEAVANAGTTIQSREIFKELVVEVFKKSENPDPGHKQVVNITNVWHLRERFAARIELEHGKPAAQAARIAIRKAITCYAATLHLNKGANILDREGIRPGKDKPREVKKGYAPIFESISRFEGRAAATAKLRDLLGQQNSETPWKHRLPRLIFVSDMGDAFSAKGDFPFLKSDLMPAIRSESGKRHLWLWLTKRPGRMAEFAEEIGGFPENVCAMTTLTGPDADSLKRLENLKNVNASIRGLSIEPLWERIPPAKLDLKGIDWVIVGGESGSGNLTRPFAVEWAEELREHCHKHDVAFFLKQLGRNPSRNGKVFKLTDRHGGEWEKWDESLKTRQFPKAFHDYRKEEMVASLTPRPVKKQKKPKYPEDPTVTAEERAEFKLQHKIVRKGVQAFWDVGKALAVIKVGKLWRAGGYKSWDDYCRSVAGMSRGHAHRLLGAAGFLEILKTSPRGDIFPMMEAQVRPLLRLPEPEQQLEAWKTAVERAEGGQPSASAVKEVVTEILHPSGPAEKPPSRGQQRTDVFDRLKELIHQKKSWEEAEQVLKDLEPLI
jgi:protein gp37